MIDVRVRKECFLLSAKVAKADGSWFCFDVMARRRGVVWNTDSLSTTFTLLYITILDHGQFQQATQAAIAYGREPQYLR
jgi:hypothetical protein